MLERVDDRDDTGMTGDASNGIHIVVVWVEMATDRKRHLITGGHG